MPGEYAKNTEVPVSRSFDEIRRTLTRFGASAFGFEEFNSGTSVIIRFEISNLEVRMAMTMPPKSEFYLSPTGRERTYTAIETEWEKACRQRWRSLANGIKAKLALVDDGISTIEREFMSDIVMPNGMTIGDMMLPKIKEFALGDGL